MGKSGGDFKGGSKGVGKGLAKSAGKGVGKSVGKGVGKAAVNGCGAGAPAANATGDERAPCKFFGSAKGCTNEACPFSHSSPNSVAPCTFKQRQGFCERGEACLFRHIPWSSPEQARAHYAARESGSVELSALRYKQLRREGGESAAKPAKLEKEHLELPPDTAVEKDIQEETYGSTAMRMMEKMGYKAGSGLGKNESGVTKLSDPCLSLERASTQQSLGFGTYDPETKATAATRAARMADARAKKARLEGSSFVVHKLLSDDESSDGEEKHEKARDVQL